MRSRRLVLLGLGGVAGAIILAGALWVLVWDDHSALTVDTTAEELEPFLLTADQVGDGFTVISSEPTEPEEGTFLGAQASEDCQAAFELIGSALVEAYGPSGDPVEVSEAFLREDDRLVVVQALIAIPGPITNLEEAGNAINRDCTEPYPEPIFDTTESGEYVETGEDFEVTVDAEPIGIGEDAFALALTREASSGPGSLTYQIFAARDDVMFILTVTGPYGSGRLQEEDVELAWRLAEEIDEEIRSAASG